MKYNHLGRTGLKVSELGLGTMNFGMTADEAESSTVMDAAFDSGITFFDTADAYGGPQSPDMAQGFGVSEEIIGRWLKATGHRDDIVLATKLYQPMGLGPNDRGLSAFHIRRAAEASLRRLDVDHIDLLQMHHVDRSTPWEEIWQAMEQLVREGKISYVGSSNFAGWQLATAQGVADQRAFLGLVSEQSVYHLNARAIELEVIPAARYHGLGIIPFSPLGGGLLAGVLEKTDGGRRASERIQQQIATHRPQLERYEALCRELGAEPASVAQAWVIANPAVSSTIVGSRTAEQVRSSVAALDVQLAPDTLAELDTIWPGPGGEAPEAYAW